MRSRGEESERERCVEDRKDGGGGIVDGSRNLNNIARQIVDIGHFIKTPNCTQCLGNQLFLYDI